MSARRASPFAPLAARVDAAWARARYDMNALAPIAAEALSALPSYVPTSFDGLTEWLFAAPDLPTQRSREQSFGQPPVTVYTDERFFIELLFWESATTGIHQHAFAGAFRVLSGSSLHAVYDFTSLQTIDERLELGDLRLLSAEVLGEDAVRPIAQGRSFIHAAFHLENPSVTLVVRTHADQSREFEYKPPGLAIHGAARDDRTTKLTQLMTLLASQSGDVLSRRVASALQTCDAFSGVLLLLRARRLMDADPFAELLPPFVDRFPVLGERLGAVADEERRRFVLLGVRARITDAENRFFLALMMNLPGRESILAAVAQRSAVKGPVVQLLDWLRASAHRDGLGFRLDEPLIQLLGGILDGGSPASLSARFKLPESEILRATTTFARIPVLTPLFRV